MREYLILHVVNTLGKMTNEAVIDGLSIGNNMGVNTRGLNPLHFVLLDQLLEEIATGV